jgi:hypothetical protein
MTIPNKLNPPNLEVLEKLLQEGLTNLETNDGHPGKDFEHYVFEAAMEAYYGLDIWTWWNARANY